VTLVSARECTSVGIEGRAASSVQSSPAHGASVTRLDPTTGRVIATIPVGTQPATIGAGSVWTANYDGTIGRINPSTNQSASVGQFPHLCGWPTVAGGAIWVYVCDAGQPYVARVDIATGMTTATIPVGSNQSSLLWADDVLWMTTFPDGELLRIDPRTGSVRQRIALPGCPILGRQSYGFGSLWVSLLLRHRWQPCSLGRRRRRQHRSDRPDDADRNALDGARHDRWP